MSKNKKTFFLVSLIMGIFLFLSYKYEDKEKQKGNEENSVFQLFSEEATAKELNKTTLLPNFVEIVKEEKPAVVNISSRGEVKHPSSSHRKRFRKKRDPFNREPFDPFEDFFEKFFREMPPQEIPRRSLGSGFIINREGYILTNNHVIEGANSIEVTLSNGKHDKKYEAKIIGQDKKTDIALIKIEAEGDLPIVKLGNSDKLEVGEWVVAIGNPFGLSQTVTVGVVSAKERVIGAGPYDNFIQTDASINPGNSGGPLINTNGEVVGINSLIYTGMGNSGGNIGIGFAIPINMVKEIINDLKEKGSVIRGWLGVMVQRITEDLAKAFKQKEGALVSEVIKGGPADKAGFKRGDIIIEFAGKKIKLMEDLPRIVAATKPDTKVKVLIIRNGRKKTLKVALGTLKDEVKITGRLTDKTEKMGMTVEEIDPEQAAKFNLDPEELGVLVTAVKPGSTAQEAGIRRGDLIKEINRTKIKDLPDYENALEKVEPEETILFLVKRGKNTIYIAIKMKKDDQR